MISPDIHGGQGALIVSPQHGLLLKLDGTETLVRAAHLARMRGGKARTMLGCRGLTYLHLMFEAHQVVFAAGAPAESFYPGPQAFGALSARARSRILAMMPRLDSAQVGHSYSPRARDVAAWHDLPRHLDALSQTA